MFVMIIGLTVNKKLVLGVVHCPLIDKTYTAIKGKGAFCNGKRIKTRYNKYIFIRNIMKRINAILQIGHHI